jgi:hypothetical protein
MTHPINDTNDVLEDLIEAEYQLTQNPDCLAHNHDWQPISGGKLRCARCKWAPHVPARPTDTRTTTQEADHAE